MIIFGTSSKTIQLAIINLLCGFCGNPSAHALRKRITKFSLFFVPLFPIAPAKHSMQCTFCGAQTDISKENAEQLLAQSGGQPQAGGQPHAQGQQQGYAQPQQPQQPQQHQQPQQGNPFAGGPVQGGQGGPSPQNPYQG